MYTVKRLLSMIAARTDVPINIKLFSSVNSGDSLPQKIAMAAQHVLIHPKIVPNCPFRFFLYNILATALDESLKC